MKLVPVRPETLTLLDFLEVTPDGPPWIVEVEEFVKGPGPAQVLKSGQGEVVVISDDAGPFGVAVHRPHQHFAGTQLLAAIVIDHRFRGTGRGKEALQAVLDRIFAATTFDFVVWLVHGENEPMRALSAANTGEGGVDNGDGYVMFVAERP